MSAERPLERRRILVTRRPEQAATLAGELAALGAEVIEIPTIEVVAVEDPAPLDAALRRLETYDWLLLTSANAVRFVAERLEALGLSLAPAAAGRLRVGSVGASTTAAFEARFGRPVDLQPAAEFRAEGLAAALSATGVSGRRCLLPASDKAREVLPELLVREGAEVDRVVAYCTRPAPGVAERVRAFGDPGVDMATFASPSAVEGLRAAAPEFCSGLPAAVIGPVTERAARDAGLDVRVVAAPSTEQGLVAALAAHFGHTR